MVHQPTIGYRFNGFLSAARGQAPAESLPDLSPFPLISIVIPSFNHGKYLERAILSVRNQGYPRVELIVIDGGSTDDSLAIIEKYEKDIAYWVSEPDSGQSEALNKGFATASGDIFGWQNSDDIYLPGAFKKVAEAFLRHPDATVCFGNWCSIDAEDRVTDIHYSLKPRMPHSVYENMDAYNQTIFWRREVHERFGTFDGRLYQKMDNDMILRFLINEGPSRFLKIDAFLGAFRVHEQQKTCAARMTEDNFAEERYLEEKFGFPSAGSLIGKYHRINYRLVQLFESLILGGVAYTTRKFLRDYRQRGKVL